MRCVRCGWRLRKSRCPCGAGQAPRAILANGTKVVSRPSTGPSPVHWLTGAVIGQQGRLHQVTTRLGEFWCAPEDLLASAPERELALTTGTRVWALWLDGRWYPGQVDDCEGPLRHVTWDDGDAMWLEAHQAVVLTEEARPPAEGQVVVARRWDGEYQPARVEQQRGQEFRVTFQDGEEAWVSGENLHTFPPNPFED